MNTVMGFACAMGLDMGFNSKHHDDEVMETPIHVHADGNKHEHHNEANKHIQDEKKSTEKGGCCNDKVVYFQTGDKNLTAKTIIDAPSFVAIVSDFLGIDLYNISKAYPQKNIVRFFYPPPPDILVSIQKFQV